MNQAELIEAVTREVLAALSSGDPCEDCHGSCAAHSPDKVRSVVANGADRVSYRGGGAEVPMDLAKYIDHTLLRPDASATDIDRLCDEAVENRFAAVCLNPCWAARAARRLYGSRITVASVVGFPLGASVPEIKAMEARRALRHRIGLVGRNSAHWCVTYLAAVTYGAVIVPILPDFSTGEIEHIVRHAECKLLFVAPSIFDRLEEGKMPTVAGVFLLPRFDIAWAENDKLAKLKNEAPGAVGALTPDNLAFSSIGNEELTALVYTSGTTGFSKGVMLNGNSLIANILYFQANVELTPGDNIVSFLPLAHAFGCAFDFLAPFASGCHVTLVEKIPTAKVLLPAFERLKPVVVMSVPLIIEKIYKTKIKPVIDTTKIRTMLKVPGLRNVVYGKIHDQIYAFFGSNFKELVIGGAAINRDIEDFFRRIGLRMTCGYGMTECGPLISYTVFDGEPPVGSVGRVIPYLECRIHDPDPETGIGEVQVRGENVMLGYYRDEEATAETLDEFGWLRTGDLGRLRAFVIHFSGVFTSRTGRTPGRDTGVGTSTRRPPGPGPAPGALPPRRGRGGGGRGHPAGGLQARDAQGSILGDHPWGQACPPRGFGPGRLRGGPGRCG